MTAMQAEPPAPAPGSLASALDREQGRQQALLASLWATSPEQRERSLSQAKVQADGMAHEGSWRAYQGNARATAARVLACHFPTVLAMVGDDALAVLALRLWQQHPPTSGDLGRWGAHLPELIAAQAELRPWPWLADSARLDWARHTCERSADAALAADSLQRLGDTPAEHLGLALHPGVQVLDSLWPVVSLWRAHRLPEGPERDAALQSLRLQASPAGECAVVWRHPWQAEVAVLAPPEAAWMRWWLSAPPEATLAQALAAVSTHADAHHGQGFDFGAWLAQALSCGWLVRITLQPQA